MVVNSGETIDVEVYARYANLTSNNSSVSTLFTSLVNAFALSSSGGSGLTGEDAYSSFNTVFSGGPFIGTGLDYEDDEAPKAYLNYILFSEEFIPVDFGFDQISEDAASAHEQLTLYVKVEQKGYLYIYLSNENDKIVDVYFDDFKIVHQTGVEQSDDYYPSGLTFNSFRRENSTTNDYLYNGKEKQDELDLGWLDYGARMYMSDIGRWGVMDPLMEKDFGWTPYKYGYNNPIAFTDPNGMAEVYGGLEVESKTIFKASPTYIVEGKKFDNLKDAEQAAEVINFNRRAEAIKSAYVGTEGNGLEMLDGEVSFRSEEQSTNEDGSEPQGTAWLENKAVASSFNLKKIGDAFYTNVISTDQYYAIIYSLFPPRMRTTTVQIPSMYVQVPANGKLADVQQRLANAWDFGRTAVAMELSVRNVTLLEANKIFFNGFKQGLRYQFTGSTAVTLAPFRGILPQTDVQYFP